MGISKTLLRLPAIAGISFVLVACSATPTQEPDLPEREYYEKAQDALSDGRPNIAVKHLKDLNSRYPFGELSVRAELDLIYAHLEAGDFLSAHAQAERFIKNHPDHEALDYAYYMRALSTHKGAETFMGRYFNLDPSKRDAVELSQAFDEFADFLARYPGSDYAADAKARMIYLRNTVARHELQVAQYYFKRKAPLSALRRGQEVIEHYPSSDSVEDALAVTVRAYMDLGHYDLAQKNLEILKANYPDSTHLDNEGKFMVERLPRDADPDFLYWVSLGAID